MFHDIFKKSKKQNKKKRFRIIADVHEKNSLIISELKSRRDIDLEVDSLKVGDYKISDILIERKTIGDLVSSIINKRIQNQIFNMKEVEKKILLIEGDINNLTHTKINPYAIRGFILSAITKENIPVIFAKDYKESADYLTLLAKQQDKNNISTLHHKTAKTIPEQKRYILESFPNIGPKKAKRLLDKYKFLNNIFNANEKDLEEILKSQAKDFKDILEK